MKKGHYFTDRFGTQVVDRAGQEDVGPAVGGDVGGCVQERGQRVAEWSGSWHCNKQMDRQDEACLHVSDMLVL